MRPFYHFSSNYENNIASPVDALVVNNNDIYQMWELQWDNPVKGLGMATYYYYCFSLKCSPSHLPTKNSSSHTRLKCLPLSNTDFSLILLLYTVPTSLTAFLTLWFGFMFTCLSPNQISDFLLACCKQNNGGQRCSYLNL